MTEKITAASFHYLLHPLNTFLVTCCNAAGKPNIITIAWMIPVSVNPPMIGMSIRPIRYSYQLIQETGEFVVNTVPYEIANQALFCGRRSGSEVNKFAETGLTPGQAQQVRPPIIEECLAHLECRLAKVIEIGDHHLIVGEVVAAYAKPEVLDESGLYRIDQVHPLLHLGRNRFTMTQTQWEEPTLPA